MLFFWSSINLQIRIKAIIKKKSLSYNKLYFQNRSIKKNALAISSNQSQEIESFELVKHKYENVRKNSNLKVCPEYWGGFGLVPYQIEFWEGGEFRLNKRNLYKKDKNKWNHFILEP